MHLWVLKGEWSGQLPLQAGKWSWTNVSSKQRLGYSLCSECRGREVETQSCNNNDTICIMLQKIGKISSLHSTQWHLHSGSSLTDLRRWQYWNELFFERLTNDFKYRMQWCHPPSSDVAIWQAGHPAPPSFPSVASLPVGREKGILDSGQRTRK